MHRTMPPLRAMWDKEDLQQEAFLKALKALDGFRGASSLKTWAVSLTKNHLISMARSAKHRPRPAGDLSAVVMVEDDLDQRLELRGSTRSLLGWLRSNPEEVDRGWEVLNLLLWSGGSYPYVALAMTVHTKEPWTVERTRNVVRRIKDTPRGRALCSALGITCDDEDRKRGA